MKTCSRAAIIAVILCALARFLDNQDAAAEAAAVDRAQAIRGSLGTYDGEPRGKDGRVDIPRLISELVEIRANTYHWLINHAATDWDDLQRFLPLARRHQVRVWVCLVPPSESPPHTKYYSEPFRLDYQRWAVELAKLSVREPNLVAWSIDDFQYSLRSTFAPAQMRKILGAARAINPSWPLFPACISARHRPVCARLPRPVRRGFVPLPARVGRRKSERSQPGRGGGAEDQEPRRTLDSGDCGRLRHGAQHPWPFHARIRPASHARGQTVRRRRPRLLSPESEGIVGKVSRDHGTLPRLVRCQPNRKAAISPSGESRCLADPKLGAR